MKKAEFRENYSKLMERISEITYSDSKESNLKRDNANVDGNTPMGMMLQYGSLTSKEFCFTQVIKPKYVQLHQEGDIHIHDADFINMGTLTCCQIDLEKLFKNGFNTGHGYLREPNDLSSYSALSCIALQSNQNSQHGGQSIPAFDFYLAPGVKKTFIKSYYDSLYKYLRLFCDLSEIDFKVFASTFGMSHILHPQIKMNADFRGLIFDFINQCLVSSSVRLVSPLVSSLVSTKHLVSDFKVKELIERILDNCYKNALEDTEKKTHQAMEAFVHNLNTMHSRAGAQVPFTSINFGTDTSPEGRMVSRNLLLAQEEGLGKGETPIFPILIFKVKEGINYNPEDINVDLFKLSCRVSAKRLFPNFSFLDAPFNKEFYVEGRPESEVAYMGCRTRVASNVCGEDTVTGRGNLSFTTINLPRLGIEYGKERNGQFDKPNFYHKLDEIIEDCIQQLLERYQIQGSKQVKNFPFLMGQGIWRDSEQLTVNDSLEKVIKHGTLTVGFIGLAECLKACIGMHHGESQEAQKLGLEIIGHMRERMDEAINKYQLNFSLIATPAEGLSGRFTRIDRKKYGEIPGVTDRDYYTNSFHIPVYHKISAFNKIKLEAPYHALTNGGHISYIEMEGDPAFNIEAFESVIRCMKESGIGYGSINHSVDRDPVCGYSGVIEGEICPKCGRNIGVLDKKHYIFKRGFEE